MPTRLLAVDTCSEVCGVALAVDGKIEGELIVNPDGTHTKTVMDAVDTVLKTRQLNIAQIDAFAVTQGPGSFTGLRIGISTVKGFAAAMEKPMIGISSLDVLAHQASGDSPLVCSLMDARRNEVYWCVYRRGGQGLVPLTSEKVGPATQIVPHIDRACTMIGNGTLTYRQVLAASLKEHAVWAQGDENTLRPSILARLGWAKYHQGGAEDVDGFVPVYLRKSDAEISRKHP